MQGCLILLGGLFILSCLVSAPAKTIFCAIIILIIFIFLVYITHVYTEAKKKSTLKELCELLGKINKENPGWQDSQWIAVNEFSTKSATAIQVSCRAHQFTLLCYDAGKKEASYIALPFTDLHSWKTIKEQGQSPDKIKKNCYRTNTTQT